MGFASNLNLKSFCWIQRNSFCAAVFFGGFLCVHFICVRIHGVFAELNLFDASIGVSLTCAPVRLSVSDGLGISVSGTVLISFRSLFAKLNILFALNSGTILYNNPGFIISRLHPNDCHSPLPQATAWLNLRCVKNKGQNVRLNVSVAIWSPQRLCCYLIASTSLLPRFPLEPPFGTLGQSLIRLILGCIKNDCHSPPSQHATAWLNLRCVKNKAKSFSSTSLLLFDHLTILLPRLPLEPPLGALGICGPDSLIRCIQYDSHSPLPHAAAWLNRWCVKRTKCSPKRSVAVWSPQRPVASPSWATPLVL